MFLKKLPKENYHILGYITFLYLAYIVAYQCYGCKLDYGYYEILRWLVTSFSAWSVIRVYKNNSKSVWILIFSAIAILFNPVIKIALDKHTWPCVDFIVLLIFMLYPFRETILKKLFNKSEGD